MAAVSADKVVVELEGRLSKYNRDVNASRGNFDKNMLGIERSATRAERVTAGAFDRIKRAAVGLAAAVSVAALARGTRDLFDFAAGLGETAQQIGVTVEQLQVLNRAAIANGVSQGTMESAVAKLNRTLGDARAGNKQAAAEFEALFKGTSASVKDFTSAGEALPAVADAIARIPDPARQAAAATAFFGRSGAQLLPILTQGAAGLERMAEEARAAGLITAEMAAKADDASDKIDLLAYSFRTRLAIALVDNLPAIEAVISGLERLINAAARAQNFLNRLRVRSELIQGQSQAQFGITPGIRQRGRQRVQDAQREILESMRRRALGGSPFAPGSQPRPKRLPTPEELGEFDYQAPPTGGGGGGKDAGAEAKRAAERLARERREAAERLRRYTDDVARLEAEQISALADLSGSQEARAAAELNRIEVERGIAARSIAAEEGLDSAQRERLLLLNDQLAKTRADLIRQGEAERLASDAREVERARLATEAEIAQEAVGLARTAGERRDLELRLLDLQRQEEEARLASVIASKESSEVEKQIARERRAELDRIYGQRREATERGTMSPMQDYLDKMRRTPAEINEDFERIAVSGLESLNDGIVDAITGAKSLGEAFSDVADQIIADLLRIAVQQLILKPLVEALGGSFGGGGSLFGGGRAKGGRVQAGRVYMVGEKGPEPFIPGASGFVAPNSALAKVGGTNITVGGAMVNFHIDAPGASAQTVALIRATLAEYAPTFISAAERATIRTLSRQRISS